MENKAVPWSSRTGIGCSATVCSTHDRKFVRLRPREVAMLSNTETGIVRINVPEKRAGTNIPSYRAERGGK